MILVKILSNTFEFQDLSKIVKLAKKKNIFTFLDNTGHTIVPQTFNHWF